MVFLPGVHGLMFAPRRMKRPARVPKIVDPCVSSEYGEKMRRSATKMKSLFLPGLFVVLSGCSGGQSAHHYVPPTLPPMDPDAPSNANASVAKKPAPQTAPDVQATPKDPEPQVVQTAAAEPGHASGPCPAPTNNARQILARALEMETKTTDPEPHRAIAEAIRLRLDEIFRHGCFRRLDDDHLLEAIVAIAPDPKEMTDRLFIANRGDLGILASYGNYGGGFVATYRWHEAMIRTSMIVSGEQGDLDKQLLTLTAKMAKLPGYPEPVLVLGNTHPWMSSCWRAMRLRILAPSGDPLHPTALLDKPTGGRWCEGITSEIKGDRVSFIHDNWGGPWSTAFVQRTYTYTWELVDGKMVQRFGFAPKIEYLPEDWLMGEWDLAQEATVESARDRLKSIHDQLHKVLVAYEKSRPNSDSEYSQEMFPVSATERRIALYCSTRETNKHCKEWPQTVDVFIELRDGKWYVKDLVQRK